MTDPNDDGDWGGRPIPQELRAELLQLSNTAGGWIYWRDGEDIPIKEHGPAFVPTQDWQKTYDAHERARQEHMARYPRRYVDYVKKYAKSDTDD